MLSTPDDTPGEVGTEPPIAYARAERAKHNSWRLVVVQCPHCLGRHNHGGGTGAKPTYGVRVAPCVTDGIAGYQLRSVGGAR